MLNLYVKESGNPAASRMIVFLHGGGVSGWMWEKVIPFFQDGYCLIPDLPGHGRSGGSPPFSISCTAGMINDMIAAKAEGREVIVVGFSLGSQVLVEMLCQSPRLIHYAIINSCLLRPMPVLSAMITPAIGMSLPLTKFRWFSKLQARTLYVDQDQFEQYHSETLQMGKDMLVSIMKENMSYSLSPRVVEADTRLLVTVGENEKGVMIQSAKDLLIQNDRADGVMFPGVGHGIPLAEPSLFHRVVDDWLSSGIISREVYPIQVDRP